MLLHRLFPATKISNCRLTRGGLSIVNTWTSKGNIDLLTLQQKTKVRIQSVTMRKLQRGIAATVLLIAATTAQAQSIVGRVVDAKTKEPLIGAVVSLQGTRRQADHQERHLPAQKMGVYRRWYGLDYRMGQLGS